MTADITNPTPAQIMEIGDQYKGRASAGDEWSVNHLRVQQGEQGDPVRWYSGVGTEVYALCKRLKTNPSACLRIRDAGDGVFFDLDPNEVRSPAVLVNATPASVRSERARKALGGPTS